MATTFTLPDEPAVGTVIKTPNGKLWQRRENGWVHLVDTAEQSFPWSIIAGESTVPWISLLEAAPLEVVDYAPCKECGRLPDGRKLDSAKDGAE